ncbi:LysM peptidoglycan-binding domain-containing protein [uncultured Desulfobacter sp.]|uniref:LysM peptidoglycan-binding domain-containing protein n=1 Tax=uncultured Desulfobacter sp. TaxID=240139 RepID=UPI002AAA9F75|nr:LysM peptidoglycan-binding domain-containing protein [uncultured Desulfobacter sp.]
MKIMTKHDVPIFTPDKNTNPKENESGGSAMESGGSLLKKNEFTMILLAALAVTALVFFFFFWGSPTPQKDEKHIGSSAGTEQIAQGFEARISSLEVSLAKLISSSDPGENQPVSRAVSDLDQRITRIETAVNLKLDTLIERVGKLEGQLNKPASVVSAPPPKSVVKPNPEVKKTIQPVPEKKVQQIKKKAVKPKETNQFHTVQKGETLWSISQKYKTSVPTIRKLNNMTPEDKIYPGSNLLVR